MRPKFCVGEEVKVRGITSSKYNTDKVEVTSIGYTNGLNTEKYIGWRYTIASVTIKDIFFMEGSLRKIPPSSRVDWEDCVFQPIKDLEKA